MSLFDTATKRSALLVFTLSSFLTPFMGSSVSIALPVMGTDFVIDAVLLSWVETAYLLTAAIFLVPFGRLADIHGRRKIYIIGISIYTLFSFLCGISNS
ncbi:MAG: MFS transporter, partial [candidate division Zixibacteria bacterium]|nr:MFS transporter [candidate division Zixibacteria bacterium]